MDNVIKIITALKEFEGIIGTLLGILLGTIISYFQNNYGKINIFQTESEYYFSETRLVTMNHDDTRIVTEKVGNGDRSSEFNFRSNIEIYNSSNTRKVLRNIRLCVESNKGFEYKKLYTDSHEAFEVLNIEAKTITSYNIYSNESRSKNTEGLFFNKIDTVYIEYENTKGKTHRLEVENLFKTLFS